MFFRGDLLAAELQPAAAKQLSQSGQLFVLPKNAVSERVIVGGRYCCTAYCHAAIGTEEGGSSVTTTSGGRNQNLGGCAYILATHSVADRK